MLSTKTNNFRLTFKKKKLGVKLFFFLLKVNKKSKKKTIYLNYNSNKYYPKNQTTQLNRRNFQ